VPSLVGAYLHELVEIESDIEVSESGKQSSEVLVINVFENLNEKGLTSDVVFEAGSLTI
jgi:hypothetical protein